MLRALVRRVILESFGSPLVDAVQALPTAPGSDSYVDDHFRARQVPVIEVLEYGEDPESDDAVHAAYKAIVGSLSQVEFDALPIERVDPSELLATQPTCDRDKLIEYATDWKPDEEQEDFPVVLRHDDQLYLIDGHHRVLVQVLAGMQDILVTLVNGS